MQDPGQSSSPSYINARQFSRHYINRKRCNSPLHQWSTSSDIKCNFSSFNPLQMKQHQPSKISSYNELSLLIFWLVTDFCLVNNLLGRLVKCKKLKANPVSIIYGFIFTFFFSMKICSITESFGINFCHQTHTTDLILNRWPLKDKWSKCISVRPERCFHQCLRAVYWQ